MSKRILICIDGTGNDPSDAVEDFDEDGIVKDNSISNVLKLHLLAGGKLDNSQTDAQQHSFYYMGVGNRGLKIRPWISAAFALTEPRRILREAYKDLVKDYQRGDSIFIFGFSRGAAIARMLACHLEGRGIVADEKNSAAEPAEIVFLGLWDTVASFGDPNLDRDKEPTSAEVEEKGRIASNVREAYHLVSVDDPRLAFRPMLMGFEERVHEIWFPGVHSDVGGGYREDALSDVSLEFMLKTVGLKEVVFKNPSELDYGGLAGRRNQEKMPPIIEFDDVRITPDVKGPMHLKLIQDKKELLASRTLGLRNVYVAVNDKRSSHPPVIHHSVVDRIKDPNLNYRPENLSDLKHEVVFADGSTKLFERGLSDLL